MPSKYQMIVDQMEKTFRDVTSNTANWMQFLITAANNYKYSFKEQILIYAQKPDATACAEMETWNKVGRWVNKGTKGIALLNDDNETSSKLRHVFDVSNTNNRTGRNIYLWKHFDIYQDEVVETLENSFGEIQDKTSFVSAIKETTRSVIKDNIFDYYNELLNVKHGSLLEELDDFNTETWLESTVINSTIFMLMSRCDINPFEHFTEDDFERIADFNTNKTLSALGECISDISEMVLREIATTVTQLQRQERTLEKESHNNYNNINTDSERGFENGNHIYSAWGLSTSRPITTGESASGQIRQMEARISQGSQKGDFLRIDSFERTEGTPGGRGSESRGDVRTARKADEGSAGRDGTAQEVGHDDLGRNDEQHQERSGGNSQERADLLLNNLPTEESQINMITEAEELNSSAFVISQEDIDAVLTRGSGFSHGKLRIYEQFLKRESAEDNIKFLKDEYGTGGSYPAVNGRDLDEGHDSKGIVISRGSLLEPDASILLSWSQVGKRIGELIEVDRFLNAADKENFPKYLKDNAQREERREISKDFMDLVRDYNDFITKYGEADKALNTYYLSSCSSEFVVGNKKMHARTSQGDFILPMMREALREIVAEGTPHTERAQTLLEKLSGELTLQFEPTYDELNPPPEPIKEYQFSLGDTVYIGAQNYEILNLNDESVRLFDESFPLINKVMSRADFDIKVAENPYNDHLLHVVDKPAEEDTMQVSEKLPVYDQETEYEIEQSEAENVQEDNSDLIGKKIIIDGNEFLVEEAAFGSVKMRDLTFEKGVGFPITRVESVEYIRKLLAEIEHEELSAPLIKISKGKQNTFDLHPEIKKSERNQYAITNDDLGVGTPLERYANNAAAIRLLKTLEAANRFATPDEQEVLSRYVGWGGLADCFDEKHGKYIELKELLDEDEYSAARESTLTAFYTPPVVIKAMYKALENMNFTTGNILEPSCGVGNFLGLLPDSMRSSQTYGVELDSISGRIAQQLYQNSSIAVQGLEETDLPDSFFDVSLGNVPFGQFKVLDKRYDKHKFLIHDYFFAKTLDKVRPGGVIAFITSKGTMDKENPAVRKYIAQRADLLGAIRLPNNTFKASAGTEVTSDIIFLQKRDRIIDIEPSWVHLNKDSNGITMNQYFVDNPDMIMGEMKEISGPFGPEAACLAFENQSLEELLDNAIQNIHAQVIDYEADELAESKEQTIPADASTRNFSYTIVDGKLYYRENSRMKPVEVSNTAENRIKGMIEIRECVRTLIEYQTDDFPDSDIQSEQKRLNTLYDEFTKKYGLISSRANKSAFSEDSSYPLISALEVIDNEGNLESKADMFTKRTIKPNSIITSVDTASEALAVSMSEKACVDMNYMCELTGKTDIEVFNELKGVIFLNPMHGYGNNKEAKYLMADEYLSGNVKEKLESAKRSAELYPDDYNANVEILEKVQPADLSASEINVRLGSTWIPSQDVEEFVFDLLDTPRYAQWKIKVHYSNLSAEWNIENKNYDSSNIKAFNTYGTQRINAYRIIEETLNLKDVRIFDYVEDEYGKKKAVLNKKETAIAQGKQEQIKEAFNSWIWTDPKRREQLTRIYNDKFNNTRPREYDGSHITFNGINTEIKLREHQVNAVARIMYGGNALLAHVVGAGKTYEMIAAAMESKRLGLCNKSLFVVPNHLTEQWATEFMQLYPSANILVATKKDFEPKNRKRFTGRISTGDYDAVIIGHSQFEKIPISIERQRAILEEQRDEILDGIAEAKRNRGDNFTVKQLEKSKKAIAVKLEKLNDQSRKDDVVTFEELGVDKLYIDESHFYKNLFLYTKMRNVGGIAQTEAQKSSDLFMKCRYLDELTGGKGTVFATGTPISNSMVEMYTVQRYLQYSALKKNNLQHFDAWASTFGETVTAIELSPEGTGYRAKTRFSKFFNLPELMNMFKEVADIQTADMLKLPVPKANYHNVSVKPSDLQIDMVAELADRAERVRNKMVDSSTDNMLKITNDGRKLALDQRLINDMLPDFEGSKVNVCANNVYRIWEENKGTKATQLVFCDLSTPKDDGSFSVYTDIRNKLIEKGIPDNEVRFIHEATTEEKKKVLFDKVRKGEVRVLLGSTAKMGAGTNVQDLLIALHDLDCPWRPSDLEQRSGRIVRQGNKNEEVDIYRYVTEQTFDAYLYQLVEGKQKFISQIMTSKTPVRSAEDIDEASLSYAEIKMLATGNPYIKEKMDLDIQVAKLKLLKQSYLSERYILEDKLIKNYPREIKFLEERIAGLKQDKEVIDKNTPQGEVKFLPMKVGNKTYTEKAEAGEAILKACKAMKSSDPVSLGEYRGFPMSIAFDITSREYKITLKKATSFVVSLGNDANGNILRIDNALESTDKRIETAMQGLENTHKQVENAQAQLKLDFSKEDELTEKSRRLEELNTMLSMEDKIDESLDSEGNEEEYEYER